MLFWEPKKTPVVVTGQFLSQHFFCVFIWTKVWNQSLDFMVLECFYLCKAWFKVYQSLIFNDDKNNDLKKIDLSPGNVVKDFGLLKLQSEIDRVTLQLELQDLSDVITVFAALALIK